MQTARTRLQKFLSYAVSATIALQAFGVFLPTSSVHAAAGDLVINEVHWAGSTGNTSDEWIELYNNSGASIDFSVTPFTIEISDATNVVLDTITIGASAPSIPNGGYLVVHNNPAGSTLDAGALSATFEPAVDFTLPNIATNYRVLDNALAEVDAIAAAAPGDPIPFEGSLAEPMASMTRISPVAVGTNPASWITSETVGANFLSGVEQYGTPGAANLEVVAPSNTAFSPLNSVELPSLPMLSGDTGASATDVIAKVTKMGPVPGSSTQVFPVAASSFSGSLTLDAGRYQVAVAALNAAGNRSAWVNVAANAAMNEFNYVVIADTSSVVAPVLDQYLDITNEPVSVLSGTSVGNTEVDVLVNGEYQQTVAVGSDFFIANVTLIPNSVSVVSFISVDAAGDVSTPVTATVTHDNVAPLAVDTTKVIVSSNMPGTNDSLVGEVGAAEADALIVFFADAAASEVIATAVVEADGSFPSIDLGDNQYGVVYMMLMDAAGNQSALAMVENPITFVPAGGITITANQVLQDQARFSWNEVPGAVNYLVKYRAADGTFGPAMKLCAAGAATCAPQLTLINLSADTSYVVAVAAIDMYGNSSSFVEYSFKTVPAPVVTPPAATVITAEAPTTVVKKTTTTVKPAPTPVPTATPSATPEAGEVKSSTDDVARNWTPWIILGVLAGIAALATLGYFYWFGGAAGEAALAAAAAAKAKSEANTTKESGSKKGASKEKRW